MAAILIVDDSKFMRKMLSDILGKNGHEIVGEAENAKEAVEFCEKLNPDVVTLDMVMDEVDGVDAISGLKAMLKMNPKIKVVMISSMSQEDMIKEFIQAGASDFIVKPFQPPKVVEVIESALKSV